MILYNLGIDELFVSEDAEKLYRRARLPTVGAYLTTSAVARQIRSGRSSEDGAARDEAWKVSQSNPFVNEICSAADDFVREWNEVTKGNNTLERYDPAACCVAVYRRCRRLSFDLRMFNNHYYLKDAHPASLRWLSDAKLTTMASLLFGLTPKPGGDALIEDFPQPVQAGIFNAAINVCPPGAWTPLLWSKYVPRRVHSHPFDGIHFAGNKTRVIHEVATSQGWKSLGDFCNFEPNMRYTLKGFGSFGAESICKKIIELAGEAKFVTVESFRETPLLEMFDKLAARSDKFKERWTIIVRGRSGLDGKPMTYAALGRAFDRCTERMRSLETQAWLRISRKEPWRSLAIQRIEELMGGMFGRLTLETLEEEDPWFSGCATKPEVFRYLVSWLARFSSSDVEVATDGLTHFLRRKLVDTSDDNSE